MNWNRFWYGPLRDEAGVGDGTGDNKETKVAPKSDKIKIGEKEYDPKAAASAVSLYEALQDPETGTEIIETLARRAGLFDKDIKLKPGETQREAESRFGTKLLAKLGKDYKKFADEVGPVFDEAVKEYIDERLGRAEATSTQNTWEAAVDTFATTHTLTDDIQETMKDLIDEAPPNFARKGFDSQRYLTRMYNSALAELDIEEPEAPAPKRSKRSASRDKDGEGGLPAIVVREQPKNVTIDDAIEAAMSGIRFKRRS